MKKHLANDGDLRTVCQLLRPIALAAALLMTGWAGNAPAHAAASATFESEVVDFGDIVRGADPLAEFTLKNTGTELLRVQQLKPG